MAVSAADLNQLYLAYFGRPADLDGLHYYTSQASLSIWDVASAFSASPESQAIYGSTFGAAAMAHIYNNLFDRDPEPAGLLYWSQEVATGRLSAAGAALGILLGAQNEDLATVTNKLFVGNAFTQHLQTASGMPAYAGDAAAAQARVLLLGVTSNPVTVSEAIRYIDTGVIPPDWIVHTGSGAQNPVDSSGAVIGVKLTGGHDVTGAGFHVPPGAV